MSLPADEDAAVSHGAKPSSFKLLVETWKYRRLIPWVASKMLVRMYMRTYLGRAWILLSPGLQIIAGTVIFGGILGVQGPPGGPPYIIFLTIGLMCWTLFERSLYMGTASLDRYRRITNSLSFPLLVIPIGGAVLGYLFAGINLLYLTGLVLYFWIVEGDIFLALGPKLLAVPAGMALALLVAWSFLLWTATLNAWTRDVRLSMRSLMVLWLYLTPVVYPLSLLPSQFQTLVLLNPMTAPVELVRLGLSGSAGVRPLGIAITVGVILLVGSTGLLFFNRFARQFMARSTAARGNDEEEDELI